MMTRRCSFCILPANLPGITLDENGKCNYCQEFESHYMTKTSMSAEETKKRFESLVEKLRRKGGYECLVPLSGGKDSSYVLYEIVKTYNMKALAFNFDNGFRCNEAVRNIEALVDKLGVDLIQFKLSRDMMNKLFKTFLQRAGEFCTPCNMLIGLMGVRIAKQYGLKAIMTGNSQYMTPGLGGVSPATYFDRAYYFNVIRGLIDFNEVRDYVVPPYTTMALQRIIGSRPQVIDVLEYLRPSISHIHDVLTKQLAWKQPGGDIQHGDCMLNAIKDYLMYKKWQCTEVTAVYSAGCRTGEFSRQEALEKALSEECTEVPGILPHFLEQLGMTEAEFEEASNKHFTDIPNVRSKWFFQIAKKAVMKIESLKGRR